MSRMSNLHANDLPPVGPDDTDWDAPGDQLEPWNDGTEPTEGDRFDDWRDQQAADESAAEHEASPQPTEAEILAMWQAAGYTEPAF